VSSPPAGKGYALKRSGGQTDPAEKSYSNPKGNNRKLNGKNICRQEGMEKVKDHWVSFESDPRLRVTKQNIYGRCVPCMTGLYEQLQKGKEIIELREAFHCWKVIAVLVDQEECLEVLSVYEDRFLEITS